jgi:phosphatidylglycerophosphate synthase
VVRAHVNVTPVYLRRLFWARPLSPPAVARAAERIGDYDVDRLLLESAVKSTDGFFTTFFVSPYSKYIARWAARRGLTPNQVTAVSMLLGLVAAAAFATGERWGLVAGAVLLQLSFTTDCVDGQLARYTRQFSKLGAWLDSMFDRTKEYLVFAGLAIGAAGSGDGVWLLACAAITLQTVRHTSDFSYMAVRHQTTRAAPQPPIEQPLDHAGAAAATRRRARAAGEPVARAKRSLAARILAAWRKLDRSPALRWIKRMAAFPIGERFAVISITAALFTPRVTFMAWLAWGGLALLYTQTGRVLRSLR